MGIVLQLYDGEAQVTGDGVIAVFQTDTDTGSTQCVILTRDDLLEMLRAI